MYNDIAEVAAPADRAANSVIQSVGSLIDERYELEQRKREIGKELKDLNAQIELLDTAIFGWLDKEELTQGRGRVGKISITELVLPQVKDWDQFGEYVIENRALHLLERRPASVAWRELFESGELVQGTMPWTKRSLSVRKA